MGTALETLLPTGASLTVAADTFVETFKLLGGNMVMEAVRFYLENNPANLPSSEPLQKLRPSSLPTGRRERKSRRASRPIPLRTAESPRFEPQMHTDEHGWK